MPVSEPSSVDLSNLAGDQLQYIRELEFDARVALPEAQERFKRAESKAKRLRGLERAARQVVTASGDWDKIVAALPVLEDAVAALDAS